MPETESKNEKLLRFRKLSKIGGGEARIAKHHEKGKLTARERLDILLVVHAIGFQLGPGNHPETS